ncbi:twin-arginine translocase subunit TatC [Actinotalea solisilvae]|uniref:twin-arginine translocase subunit TatC n=1 Tax=Actinotalea solisilvae TaxID=2072922 RepID=UPI0018F1CB37|nr:twin-arginine translocase subunit TatC [Actinotalea solisilvae]
MPLREHVRELRTRALLATAGLLVGAVVGWIAYPWLFEVLQEPVVALAEQRDDLISLNFGGVATPLDLQIKVALFAGAILSSPWWIYQLWAFVTPGLTRRERWTTLGFLGAGVPLFLAGGAVAWWLLPKAVGLLSGLTPADTANLIDAQSYLEFIMRMVLAFGLAFLLPVVMVGLNLAGLVRGSTWAHGWRWAVLLCFVFAAVATPTADAISMFSLALPMCLLYGLAVGLCLLHDRRADRRDPFAGTPDDGAGGALA